MKVNLLQHTWKSNTQYTYTYILITNTFTINDIIQAQASGTKIVFFGSRPESVMQWMLLNSHGVRADVICDTITCETNSPKRINGVIAQPHWELCRSGGGG
jgi:hypothetical protein